MALFITIIHLPGGAKVKEEEKTSAVSFPFGAFDTLRIPQMVRCHFNLLHKCPLKSVCVCLGSVQCSKRANNDSPELFIYFFSFPVLCSKVMFLVSRHPILHTPPSARNSSPLTLPYLDSLCGGPGRDYTHTHKKKIEEEEEKSPPGDNYKDWLVARQLCIVPEL